MQWMSIKLSFDRFLLRVQSIDNFHAAKEDCLRTYNQSTRGRWGVGGEGRGGK